MMRLIDADELKTAFPCGEYVRTESVRATIDSMPTIDAEPVRHGKWINSKCSECGCDRVITKVYCNNEVVWTATYKDNYCPNCGVKIGEMEE